MHAFIFDRRLSAILFAIAVLIGLALHTASTGAVVPDEPKKQPTEEEEKGPKKPPKKAPKVDDNVSDTPKKPEAKSDSAVPRLPELAAELEQARNPVFKEFFDGLAVPHDTVALTLGREIHVEPISIYITPRTKFKGTIELHRLESDWRKGPIFSISHGSLESIEYYETIAVDAASRLLQRRLHEQPADSPTYASRRDSIRAARTALAAVLAFHESARKTHRREGDGWNNLSAGLRSRLLSLYKDELALLGNIEKDWQDAFDVAAAAAAISNDAEMREQVAHRLVPFIEAPLQKGSYAEVRRRMDRLRKLLHGTAALGRISEQLDMKARELVQRADGNPDLVAARQLLLDAESISPRLSGLHEKRVGISNAYPILYVGVQALPELMSPALAATDAERQACELIFESLVKPDVSPRMGETYRPQLAAGKPRIIPAGRQFTLSSDARWSNGKAVTFVDVRHTVQRLQEKGWADLIDEVRPGLGANDPLHLDVGLRQGVLDPLSLMAFKILPASLEQVDESDFAKKPIGSGPFIYAVSQTDRKYARFVANPHYQRGGKPGRPAIREVCFYHSDTPDHDLIDGRMHLLLDLPTNLVKPLESSGCQVKTLRNRRIYFLAVNHRKPILMDADVRQAIALAIDRVKILDNHFRLDFKNDPKPPHRPLNGPFPPDCWAYNPDVRTETFDRGKANIKAEAAKRAAPVISLTLKYPGDELNGPYDDAAVRLACKEMSEQIREATGFDIRLEPRRPQELRKEVELLHDYDLAYYHFDYDSEAYSLWPLFNPSAAALGKNGSNYLGYHDDSELVSLFRQALSRREFKQVKAVMHQIHEVIQRQMPIIPLWQLDTHLAIHRDLTASGLDPLRIFGNVEEWRLEMK